jgi:hypothetical protein
MAERKFQEADVRYGGRDAIPSGSDRKPIPEDEGGIRDDRGRSVYIILFCYGYVLIFCRLAQAQQFEGRGGPEDKIERE